MRHRVVTSGLPRREHCQEPFASTTNPSRQLNRGNPPAQQTIPIWTDWIPARGRLASDARRPEVGGFLIFWACGIRYGSWRVRAPCLRSSAPRPWVAGRRRRILSAVPRRRLWGFESRSTASSYERRDGNAVFLAWIALDGVRNVYERWELRNANSLLFPLRVQRRRDASRWRNSER